MTLASRRRIRKFQSWQPEVTEAAHNIEYFTSERGRNIFVSLKLEG